MKVTIEFDYTNRSFDFTEAIKFLFGLGVSCNLTNRFENAGCGMYNFELPLGIILQCYPFSTEGTFVHINSLTEEESDDMAIGDLPLTLQKNIITELTDAVHVNLKKSLKFTDDGKAWFTKVVFFPFITTNLTDIAEFIKEHENNIKSFSVEY